MRIFGALGFGIFFTVLAVFMPPVLAELTRTLITILQSTSQAFAAAGALASHAGQLVP